MRCRVRRASAHSQRSRSRCARMDHAHISTMKRVTSTKPVQRRRRAWPRSMEAAKVAWALQRRRHPARAAVSDRISVVEASGTHGRDSWQEASPVGPRVEGVGGLHDTTDPFMNGRAHKACPRLQRR